MVFVGHEIYSFASIESEKMLFNSTLVGKGLKKVNNLILEALMKNTLVGIGTRVPQVLCEFSVGRVLFVGLVNFRRTDKRQPLQKITSTKNTKLLKSFGSHFEPLKNFLELNYSCNVFAIMKCRLRT